MTKQEAFDIVYMKMHEQGFKRSGTEAGVGDPFSPFSFHCKYRGPNGMVCAAGALIKDEFYVPMIEGTGANRPTVCEVLIKSGVSADLIENTFYRHGSFVSDLQHIHDGNALPEGMKSEFIEFALKHDLAVPSV